MIRKTNRKTVIMTVGAAVAGACLLINCGVPHEQDNSALGETVQGMYYGAQMTRTSARHLVGWVNSNSETLGTGGIFWIGSGAGSSQQIACAITVGHLSSLNHSNDVWTASSSGYDATHLDFAQLPDYSQPFFGYDLGVALLDVTGAANRGMPVGRKNLAQSLPTPDNNEFHWQTMKDHDAAPGSPYAKWCYGRTVNHVGWATINSASHPNFTLEGSIAPSAPPGPDRCWGTFESSTGGNESGALMVDPETGRIAAIVAGMTDWATKEEQTSPVNVADAIWVAKLWTNSQYSKAQTKCNALVAAQ